jgi:NAD+ kinase
MKNSFASIGIVGKVHDARTLPLVETLLQRLHARGIRVCLDERLATLHPLWQDASRGPSFSTLESMARTVDLLIVIGGDGTLLATARATAAVDTPLLGINLGRFGFMVDILPHRAAEELDAILDGAFRCEPRTLINVTLLRGDQEIHHGIAINEAVLHVAGVVRILEFDTYIDGLNVGRLRADGLIMATPSGSTAYALSAGGPIVMPGVEALILVPVSPHSLNYRPLVVDGTAVIEVRLSADCRSPAQIALDGQENFDFLLGDTLRVQRSPRRFTLVHPRDHQFLHTLRTKLRWGETP